MASTYLNRTPSSTGNRKTFTISTWVKKSALSSNGTVMSQTNDAGSANSRFYFLLGSGDTLIFAQYDGASTNFGLYTNRVFRDPNAWYHIVYAFDSTNATADDRHKIWVNGVQETSFSARTNPSLNLDSFVNQQKILSIGRDINVSSRIFDGSLAHFHFIDGTAYDASYFGSTDSTTGIWKPNTSPSVTYGTNGFFLKFASSGSMGTDSSGNGNNFTVSGNLTQTQDTPSNVFATLNPLSPSGSTYSNGNNSCLTVSGTYASRPTTSTLGMSSGKYYTEIKLLAPNTGDPTYAMIGITGRPLQAVTGSEQYQHLGAVTYDYAYHAYNGHIMNNTGGSNDGTAYGNTYTTNDIIGIALDLDNNKLYFSKNGTWQNSGDPTSGATGTGAVSIVDPASTSLGFYFFGVDAYHYTPQYNYSANFGNGYFGTTAVSSAQSPSDGIGLFEYDVPSGYKALCTKSINSQEYS